MESANKKFPENYPSDALEILTAMAFNKGEGVNLLGSQSIRSQLYAGDYDAYQIVRKKGKLGSVVKGLANEFGHIIRTLRRMPNLIIGDIKAGSKEEWKVMSREYDDYNASIVKRRVDELERSQIITPQEAKEAHLLLKSSLTPNEFLNVRKNLRYNIIRWTPEEVIEGSKTLRDGSTYTLEEAFQSPTISKLDVIGFVQNNRYTDFSMLYEFNVNGKIINPDKIDVVKSLEEDIVYYTDAKKPFKVLKRKFALAKFKHDTTTVRQLTPILNSDLGRIYSLASDIEVLIHLLEDPNPKSDMNKIRFEIDQFKGRMANIYHLPDFIKSEHSLLAHINSALHTNNKKQMISHLDQILTALNNELNTNTPKV